MTTVAKNTLNTYTKLFEGLDAVSKKELLSRLSSVLNKTNANEEESFYKSFGSFPDDTSAEELIAEIRSSRNFRQRDINF